jgi:hypothetical protein
MPPRKPTTDHSAAGNGTDTPSPALADVDPFDPANYASARFVETDAATAIVTMCPVRKPDKSQFIRVHPDPQYTIEAAILEDRESRDSPYLVMPMAAHSAPDHTKHVTLTLAVTRGGDPFLWPIANPAMSKRSGSTWTDSALRARTTAMTTWVRVAPNMAKGGYDVRSAIVEIPEPVWPAGVTMRDLLEMAFGQSGLIRDEDHPVIQRLLGRI